VDDSVEIVDEAGKAVNDQREEGAVDDAGKIRSLMIQWEGGSRLCGEGRELLRRGSGG
jgi:hypothetical protein